MRSDLQSDAIATMRHSQLNLHILKDSNPDQTGWNRLCYRYTKDTFFFEFGVGIEPTYLILQTRT
jgi:hypothetical protein